SRNGKENIVTALESGADDYVAKPFDRDELHARLRVGRRIVGLQTSETVVISFARAVDAKSPYTLGHSERVMRYAVALADRLGLPGWPVPGRDPLGGPGGGGGRRVRRLEQRPAVPAGDPGGPVPTDPAEGRGRGRPGRGAGGGVLRPAAGGAADAVRLVLDRH